jgi:hypothetical protein
MLGEDSSKYNHNTVRWYATHNIQRKRLKIEIKCCKAARERGQRVWGIEGWRGAVGVPILAGIVLRRKRVGGRRVTWQGNRIIVPHISIRVE